MFAKQPSLIYFGFENENTLLKMKMILSCLWLCLSITLQAQINEAIKFTITDPNGNTDETILRLHPDASNNFDPNWDAWKMFTGFDELPSIYSKSAESYDFAINAFSEALQDTIVHLMIRAREVSGNYTLTSTNLGTLPANVKIAVKDLGSGQVYNLNQNITHIFPVVADSINDQVRFEVFYSTTAELTVNENNLTVTNPGSVSWNYEIEDGNGMAISSGISSGETKVIEDLPAGQYQVMVTDNYALTDTLNVEIIFVDTTSTATDTSQTDTTSAQQGVGFNNLEKNEPIIYIADNAINVDWKNLMTGQWRLRMYNLNGQVLYDAEQESQNIRLPLTDQFAQGFMLLEVIAHNDRYVKKIIL